MSIISEQIVGEMINVDIESSNLSRAEYNTNTSLLKVFFKNGAIYEYESVPWDVYTKFRLAESQGKFFVSDISRKYKYTRIDKKNETEGSVRE